MDVLIKVSNGDLRKAITYLQSASSLHPGEAIKPSTISELAGVSIQILHGEKVIVNS